MSGPETPKIDELKARLASDPGSRMFVPLGEELRKAGHPDEAERVLRTGIEKHPAYLSAWVTLGRLLAQQERHGEAVEALNRALQLDPENVVAARLAADSYLALGEKVEAIKKFKLVHAFIPSDQEVQASIETLERQLNPEKYIRPIQVTEEIPEFRSVTADDVSPLPAGEGSGVRELSSPLPAGEGSGVRAPDDPFNDRESESGTELDQFSFEGPESEVTYDMEEITEVATWDTLTPDPSPAGRGEEMAMSSEENPPVLSIVPDLDEERQRTVEKLQRWLALIQRKKRQND